MLEYNHQLRIAGADCPGNWLVAHAITKIRGVGYRLATQICHKAEIDPEMRCGFLTEDEVQLIEDVITNCSAFDIPAWMLNRQKDIESGEDLHIISNDLIDIIRLDIEREKKTRSYRGIRHYLGLPVRGQRTKTSGRGGTTIGVSKKKVKQ
ncbi:30S ribosomal protein S13 [Candidatus Heimdallarchaeota archaeon B3_Heim]|nr:MAG: 30S ribosomal protein S13 [Candidatus Heimdallarchaeota archaeon B3_Heim]